MQQDRKFSSKSVPSDLFRVKSSQDPQVVRTQSHHIQPQQPRANSYSSASAFFSKTSLFQQCRLIVQNLQRVEGFEEAFKAADRLILDFPMRIIRIRDLVEHDPVTQVWNMCCLGFPLCALLNAFQLETPLQVNLDTTLSNTNACKASLYHFLLTCKKDLSLVDADLFTISEIFQDNTASLAKAAHTVSLILDMLDEKGLLRKSVSRDSPLEQASTLSLLIQSSQRVYAELLETEMKYVQDLEFLSDYVAMLQAEHILSQATIQQVFSNLNELLDFQRRFLIGLEMNAIMPASEQRLGALLLQMEDGFSPKVRASRPLLIKPIQRICKYPLLVRELLKGTAPGYRYEEELRQGLECIVRVANKVNENRRRHENNAALVELENRIIDWKGYSLKHFGSLLVWEIVPVAKGDMEREYYVYLFETILLCCKEISPLKKQARNMSINRKLKRQDSLQLKGRIFISNITMIAPNSAYGQHALHIFWNGDSHQESFVLKLRNAESFKQWYFVLKRLLSKKSSSSGNRQSSGSTSTVPSSLGTFRVSRDEDANSQSTFTSRENEQDCGSPSSLVPSSSTQDGDDANSSQYTLLSSQHNPYSVKDASVSLMSSIGSYNNRNSPSFLPSMGPLSDDGARSVSQLHKTPSSSEHSFINNVFSNTATDASATNHAAPSQSFFTGSQPDLSVADYAYQRSGRLPSNSHLSADNRSVSTTTATGSSSPKRHSRQRSFSNPALSVSRPLRESLQSGDLESICSGDSATGKGTNTVKVRIKYEESCLVLLVPAQIGYQELNEKISHKLLVCGLLNMPEDTPIRLRMKYVDEDGDLITITSDEDVFMAFEYCVFEMFNRDGKDGIYCIDLFTSLAP
ncbi:RhoGEF Scd1 [Schizosaccharomyces japonicus yFS275]|uniref:RhoGEF Scd1 n=1 Tax=Schizosaccharomyces japonicus (strain yFS275 / FY16936) TaxID=402676 RepID=B6JVU8_SCHJY|nr:RhoGEF Scd1 [Schizosaccharomyces japonicus yFS275]EEB05499.2 RhoGEF Scd1 [Schizosaccharomyces japonicus yFS275]